MSEADKSRAQMWVVIILSVTVGLAVVIFAIGAAWTLTQEHLNISDAQLAFLTTSVGAIIGGIVTYLGVGRGAQINSTPGPAGPPGPPGPMSSPPREMPAPGEKMGTPPP